MTRPDDHKRTIESIRVLGGCKGAATLFRMVDGKSFYETLTREHLLTLIETSAEALREMGEP